MSASTTRLTSCRGWATSATGCSGRATRTAPSQPFGPDFPTRGEELLAELGGAGGFLPPPELLVPHARLPHEIVILAQGRVCHRSPLCAGRAAAAWQDQGPQ